MIFAGFDGCCLCHVSALLGGGRWGAGCHAPGGSRLCSMTSTSFAVGDGGGPLNDASSLLAQPVSDRRSA